MLSYLETVGQLTAIRDDLRQALNSETADRQIVVEQTENLLTNLLGELVTPGEPQTVVVDLLIDLTSLSMPPAYCRDCRSDLHYSPGVNGWVDTRDLLACPSPDAPDSNKHAARR